jgi:D-serine dehydratase
VKARVQRLSLDEVLDEPVDWRLKAFPPLDRAIAIRDVHDQRWHALDDFSLPVLVLRESALDHNINLLAEYCASHGVELAPHAKTPVAPQIVQRQLDAGAWGVSVANLHQARVFRHLGLGRLLIANEVIDPVALRWIATELDRDPDLELFVLADSEAGVALMERELADAGLRRRLAVLVEMGVEGGRCGCRTIEEAIVVASAIRASRHLELVGVEVYEGMVMKGEVDARLVAVDKLMRKVREAAVEFERRHLYAANRDRIVTGGGSLFFDRVADGLAGGWDLDQRMRVVLRSGSYVTHDAGEYERLSPLAGRAAGGARLEQALEIWAHVLSRPEPELAVFGFGRRDVAHDQELPIPFASRKGQTSEPLGRSAVSVFALNDQHARARIAPSLSLTPGDRIGFHVSHPCTTFDNWRVVPVVDDDYRVTDAVRCYL